MTNEQTKQLDCNIKTNTKQVSPFSYEKTNLPFERTKVSQEQLQCEFDYVRAQQILTYMLDCCLISLSEFNKITDLNRKTFSPLLAEIMA